MISDGLVRESVVAAGSFSTVGGLLTTVFNANVTGVYTGVGVATYTLGRGVDVANGGLMITPILATITNVTYTNTSDEVKVIRTWDDLGNALESAYYFEAILNAP